MSAIHVLIADDSAVVRKVLTEGLNLDPAIEVVGGAAHGSIGLTQIALLNPDLITLDVEMPGMSGLVQHRPPLFTRLLAERLDKASPVKIREGIGGELLSNEITIGETCLFRSPAQLNALHNVLLRELLAERRRIGLKKIKVWRGVFDGEVPYYLRREIDAGSERPLIRTIRGVGCQIGGNHSSRQSAALVPSDSQHKKGRPG